MSKDHNQFFSEEDFDDAEGEDFLRKVKPNRKPRANDRKPFVDEDDEG